MSAFAVLFEIERAGFRLALVGLSIRMLRSAWRARVSSREPEALRDEALPSATVLVPIRNEYCVAERVLRAAAGLDYPRDRLEVIVLDQSDDATVPRVVDVARELTAGGVRVRAVRRDPGAGCKSDSLAHGLTLSTAELVAIFDADCAPRPDFLRRAVARFTDSGIGLVQGRLTFANRDATLVTRAQAQLLDALMLVEQTAASSRGGMLHFNGTAGVWRRACLDAAGGFRPGTVTEDLDVSCRAVAAGFRIVHAPELEVLAELPATMTSFRAQQRRWTRGHMHLLREAALGRWHDARMVFHAARRSGYLLFAALLVTWPLVALDVVHPLVRYTAPQDGALFGLVSLSLAVVLLRGQALARRSLAREIAIVPASIALFFGMAIGCTFATISGLARPTSTFDRTPKNGSEPGLPRYPPSFDAIALVEIAVAASYAALATALRGGPWQEVAFALGVAVTFAWIGGSVAVESAAAWLAARRFGAPRPEGRLVT